MDKQPTLTVQAFHVSTRRPTYRGTQLRLRGHWLADVFAPRTQVRVSREDRAGKTVLVIEEIEKTGGAE
ncbi:MAG: hypothetical protein WCF84_04420 [Anaerolineae bacterium]